MRKKKKKPKTRILNIPGKIGRGRNIVAKTCKKPLSILYRGKIAAIEGLYRTSTYNSQPSEKIFFDLFLYVFQLIIIPVCTEQLSLLLSYWKEYFCFLSSY